MDISSLEIINIIKTKDNKKVKFLSSWHRKGEIGFAFGQTFLLVETEAQFRILDRRLAGPGQDNLLVTWAPAYKRRTLVATSQIAPNRRQLSGNLKPAHVGGRDSNLVQCGQQFEVNLSNRVGQRELASWIKKWSKVSWLVRWEWDNCRNLASPETDQAI